MNMLADIVAFIVIVGSLYTLYKLSLSFLPQEN